MPLGSGFGSGPYGGDPFGQTNFARKILLENIPSKFLEDDIAQEYRLTKFIRSLFPHTNEFRKKLDEFPLIRDPELLPSVDLQVISLIENQNPILQIVSETLVVPSWARATSWSSTTATAWSTSPASSCASPATSRAASARSAGSGPGACSRSSTGCRRARAGRRTSRTSPSSRTACPAHSLCGLGQTAPNPVLTAMRYFREEFEAHVREKRCPAGRCAALTGYRINEACIGCTLCAQVCPVHAIAYRPHERHAIDLEACTRCNMCFEVCQDGAVEVVSGSAICGTSPRATERSS